MDFTLSLYLTLIVSSLLATSYFIGKEKVFSSGYETLIYCISTSLYAITIILEHENIFLLIFKVLFCIALLTFSFKKGKFCWKISNSVFVFISIILFIYSIQSYNFLYLVRFVSSYFVLGSLTQAMLLGHWYLVQPGRNRKPIKNLIICSIISLLFYLPIFLFFKSGMLPILRGQVDDGWGGLLSMMWIGNIFLTIGLLIASYFSLKERSYTAVMATTGLLYLAMVTAFGSDIIFRVL